MAFIPYNPNPEKVLVGDCVVRAISKVLDQDWDDTYLGICIQGLIMKDMPSSNTVWGAYLRLRGFVKKAIPNTCPDCYTIREFAEENQNGAFVLGTGTHAVAVVNGDYYDTSDSGDEVPLYFWMKK